MEDPYSPIFDGCHDPVPYRNVTLLREGLLQRVLDRIGRGPNKIGVFTAKRFGREFLLFLDFLINDRKFARNSDAPQKPRAFFTLFKDSGLIKERCKSLGVTVPVALAYFLGCCRNDLESGRLPSSCNRFPDPHRVLMEIIADPSTPEPIRAKIKALWTPKETA